MNKYGNLKSIISSDSKKKSINDNIRKNKNDLSKKLIYKFDKKNASSKPKESDINLNNYNSETSNFVNFKNFKSKKNIEKSGNNSKLKYNNKNTITKLEDINEKEENSPNEIISKQHSKNLSNTNEKEMLNKNNKFIYESKLKKNISNFNTNKNGMINLLINKADEMIKNKMNNKTDNKKENNTFFNENNKFKNKLNNNHGIKIEKFLTSQLKNNIISKEDLLSLMDNSKSIKNKINKRNNYVNTNPTNDNNNRLKSINNCNSEIKSNILMNKKYEKSCPKLNFNKNLNYGKTQNNSHSKQLALEEINKDYAGYNNDLNYKKTSIEKIKSIRGKIIPYYDSVDENNNMISKNNLESNKKINQKNEDKNKNIIDFFLPIKEKSNNKNYNKIGYLQNIINDDDDDFDFNNQKVKINNQINNNRNNGKIKNNVINNIGNLNCVKINDKSIGLRKIRTINDKGEKNIKKDLTMNNLALKKRRPRYFDSEINNNIIDSTNILGNNLKNKSTYLNLIRKAFNNKNINKNYDINFLSNNNNKNINDNELMSQSKGAGKFVKNNTFVQKSVRDSKSLNIVRNRSNTNLNKDSNLKKMRNMKEPYISNLIKMVNDDDHRNYSLNKDYNLRNSVQNKNNIENNNDINSFIENNADISNSKSEVDENKIIENISNNSLILFLILISHKYYKNGNKIGIKKIKIFDANKSEIPITLYQTNGDYDNGKLFNSMMTNINLINKANNLRNEIIYNNIPFITEVKKDICIYFHINSSESNNIKSIQIINYNNKNSTKISPVKFIEIFKEQTLIYKGVLNNDINNINISNSTNINNKLNINKLNYTKNFYQERPFSTSKIRAQNNIKKIITQSELNSNSKIDNKNQIDVYHTARNNLFNRFNDNDNFREEYNDNNIKLFRNSDGLNKINSNKKNNNGNNTINIHINNNTNNITNLEIFEKAKNLEKNNDSYFNTMQNSEYNKSNDQNNNNDKDDIIGNNNENILMTSFNKKKDSMIDKINPENDYNETGIIEENIKINNEIKEIDYNVNNGNVNLNEINLSDSKNNMLCNYENNSLYNTFNGNFNYISFNKIKFVITSNYGHKKHVGLTGIEFYNIKGDLINVETAISIGALPKDLRTVYDDESDVRIFENVFNGFNNTDEVENMWVTKLKKSEPKSFIELYFQEKIKISKIKFYNYNDKNNLQICAKTIKLFLDDIYYGTIYLKPGVGEIAFDYIKTNIEVDNDNDYEINDTEDGLNNYKGDDFGQIITFPVKRVDEDSSNSEENINNNKLDIKYASFLYEQSYETPFMPYGYHIKFQFVSNHYKGIAKDEAHLLKYKDIGLDSIEIYNEENINVLNNNNLHKYKIISNCELFHNKKRKLILNGTQNENGNSCLFYIFEEPIHISYIKMNPLTKKNLEPSLNSVKEIKIYCESQIIYEGDLYIEHPTIALFTCDMKITKNIDEKYLSQKTTIRDSVEIKNDNYISLILN